MNEEGYSRWKIIVGIMGSAGVRETSLKTVAEA